MLAKDDWYARARRHLERTKREGVRNVLADDVRRGCMDARRSMWGAAHNCSPYATPIYIVGTQRSGTNMLINAFAKAPEAEIHNESGNSRAFSDWLLRDDAVVRSLIKASRHRCIIFKPLGDAHRLVHLMEDLGAPSPGRSIWIYRNVADRVRSVFGIWPESAGDLGRKIASGDGDEWATAGLSDELLVFMKGLDTGTMSQASGAALFWYLRNALFFELGLDRRRDVALISYDRFITEPDRFMTDLCDFAGIPFRNSMVSGIARRPPSTSRHLDIDPQIGSRCQELQRRLDDEFDRRVAANLLTAPEPVTSLT